MVRFILIAVLSGLAAAPNVSAADLENGQRLARRHCSACHATGPKHASPLPAATPFRLFWKRWPTGEFDQAIARSMVMGAHPRTPKSVTEPDGFADIIAYIRSIQTIKISQQEGAVP